MTLEGTILSKISETEKDKYCMVSLICGIFKKAELIETGSRVVVAKGLGVLGGGANGEMMVKGVKGYKHPVIRQIGSGDLTQNMVITVNSTVLYT